jgi:phosphoribosylformylglycinamidine synthase
MRGTNLTAGTQRGEARRAIRAPGGIRTAEAREFPLATSADRRQHPPAARRGCVRGMKAKIIITPKKAVVDPQGKTVQSALAHLGYAGVTAVHVGKYLEIDLAPGTDPAAARKALDEASHKFLSNPIIEDYRLEIE